MRAPTLLSLCCLMACATSGDEAKTYSDISEDPRVGEKVDRICFQRSISGFSEYGDGDGIILRRGASDRFLVTFAGACPGADSVQRVGLSNDLGNAGCLSQSSRIYLSDSLTGRGRTPLSTSSCLVKDIYAFDPSADTDTEAEEDQAE